MSVSQNNIPEILSPTIEMLEPNEIIPIYVGEYFLKNSETEIHIVGKIEFEWFPSSHANFSGSVKDNTALPMHRQSPIYQLIIGGLNFGECFFTNIIRSDVGTTIKGVFSFNAIKGDKSIAVESVRFSLPNLREFQGLPVSYSTSTTHSTNFNRLVFETHEFSITIDKVHNYGELYKKLNAKGGYLILYGGEIKSKKGSMSFDQVRALADCFNKFLHFLNGRETSLLFLKGMHEGEEIWADYSNHRTAQYNAVMSWPHEVSFKGLAEIWRKFHDMWKHEGDRDFLVSAIQWYIEANAKNTESSIIMAQTALELLYNWLIIENRKLLIGKDGENISAANKIRLLLSQLNVQGDIPVSFKDLRAYIDSNGEINDGPDSITQIRNGIIHSQEERRKKIGLINGRVKYEVLQLSIWYIELSLLFILGFNDVYCSRCSGGGFAMDTERRVPWAKNNLD